MNQQHQRLQNLDPCFQMGVVAVLLSLPFWTACSIDEKGAAKGLTLPYVEPHEVVSKDSFTPNVWLGVSFSDRFDDTVTKRIIYNSTEDSEILLFERSNDSSECRTEMLVRFPRELLSTSQWLARVETYRAAIEARENDEEIYPTVPVSFNFKRPDADDFQILDQEFRDSALFNTGSTTIDLRTDNENDLKSYITALRESYEVRIKVEFNQFRFDFKVDHTFFNEKHTWLTEVCKDETLDVAESDDENNLVQKEISQ